MDKIRWICVRHNILLLSMLYKLFNKKTPQTMLLHLFPKETNINIDHIYRYSCDLPPHGSLMIPSGHEFRNRS